MRTNKNVSNLWMIKAQFILRSMFVAVLLMCITSCSSDDVQSEESETEEPEVEVDETEVDETDDDEEQSTSLDGAYYIKNLVSRKYLGVAGSSVEDGGNVVLWEDSGNDDQKWTLESYGEIPGSYIIFNRNSGKVLDIRNGSTENGTNIQQSIFIEGNLNQLWVFEPFGDDEYFIYSYVGGGECVDIASHSTQNGANIHLWDELQTDNQKWELVPVD